MGNHTAGGAGNATTTAGGGGGSIFDDLVERIRGLFDTDAIVGFAFTLGLFVVVILVGYVLGQLAKRGYHKVRRGTPTSGQLLVGKMLQSLFVLAAVAIGLATVYGLDPVGLIAALGLASLALGFGLQNTVANLAAGVGLTLDKPFDVGDRIRVGDTWGDVVGIGLRSTRILTTSGEHVVVPNSVLDTQEVWNYTSRTDRKMRVEVPISISYASSIVLADRLAVAAARVVHGVLAYPQPRLVVRTFGDSGIDLELRCWIDRAQDRPAIVDQLLRRIKDSFDREGVHFPFPQRTISYLKDLPAPAAAAEGGDEPPRKPVMLACTRSAESARAMAERVVSFAKEMDARLVVLHVRPAAHAMDASDAQRAVNTYIEAAVHVGLPADGRLEIGDFAHVLRRVVREVDARLAVFGASHGGRFMGWPHRDIVAARQASPIPVLVIDPDEPMDPRLQEFWRRRLHEPDDAPSAA